MKKFNEFTHAQKKVFRARQRLMLCADILDLAIVEDLPASKLLAGNLKMRANRIRDDIDRITRGLAGEILVEGSEGGSKNFAYGFYTIINILKDLDEDSLYKLAEELKERTHKNGM